MVEYRIRVEILKSEGRYFIPLLLNSEYEIQGIRRNGIEKVLVHDQNGDLLGYGKLKEYKSFYGLDFKVNEKTTAGHVFSSDAEFHNNAWFDLHFMKDNNLSKVQYIPFSTRENIDYTA